MTVLFYGLIFLAIHFLFFVKESEVLLLANKNYILKKLRRIRVEDRNTGKTRVSLTDLKNITLSSGQEQVEATGTDNTKLAIFEIGKTAKLTATNGTISMGYYEMQVGSPTEVMKNKTGPKFTETLTTDNGTSITLSHKAQGTIGNEIGYIYRSERGAEGEAFMQNSTATTTQFKYTPSTKVIELPTGKFQAGDKIIVNYYPKFTEYEKLTNSAKNYSETGRVFVDAWFTDPCTDKDVPLQMVMERGKVSGVIDLSFGDQAAVQNIEIEAMTDVCSEEKELFVLYTYDMDKVDNS